jgi:hypothetical protein
MRITNPVFNTTKRTYSNVEAMALMVDKCECMAHEMRGSEHARLYTVGDGVIHEANFKLDLVAKNLVITWAPVKFSTAYFMRSTNKRYHKVTFNYDL